MQTLSNFNGKVILYKNYNNNETNLINYNNKSNPKNQMNLIKKKQNLKNYAKSPDITDRKKFGFSNNLIFTDENNNFNKYSSKSQDKDIKTIIKKKSKKK